MHRLAKGTVIAMGSTIGVDMTNKLVVAPKSTGANVQSVTSRNTTDFAYLNVQPVQGHRKNHVHSFPSSLGLDGHDCPQGQRVPLDLGLGGSDKDEKKHAMGTLQLPSDVLHQTAVEQRTGEDNPQLSGQLASQMDNSRKANWCPLCHKQFGSRRKLKRHHKRMHVDVTPRLCEHCGKTFRRLRSHLKLVHESRENGRGVVGLEHNSQYQQLVEIIKNRTDNNNNKCPACNKTLSCNRSIFRHIRNVHLKYLPHKCQFCNKAFGEKYSMLKHIQKNHHMCQYCGKTLKKAYLQSHLMRKHLLHHFKLKLDRTSTKTTTQHPDSAASYSKLG